MFELCGGKTRRNATLVVAGCCSGQTIRAGSPFRRIEDSTRRASFTLAGVTPKATCRSAVNDARGEPSWRDQQRVARARSGRASLPGRILSSMADPYQTASPSTLILDGRLCRISVPSGPGSISPHEGGVRISSGPWWTAIQSSLRARLTARQRRRTLLAAYP
jgi:hypothetical protein